LKAKERFASLKTSSKVLDPEEEPEPKGDSTDDDIGAQDEYDDDAKDDDPNAKDDDPNKDEQGAPLIPPERPEE